MGNIIYMDKEIKISIINEFKELNKRNGVLRVTEINISMESSAVWWRGRLKFVTGQLY